MNLYDFQEGIQNPLPKSELNKDIIHDADYVARLKDEKPHPSHVRSVPRESHVVSEPLNPSGRRSAKHARLVTGWAATFAFAFTFC